VRTTKRKKSEACHLQTWEARCCFIPAKQRTGRDITDGEPSGQQTAVWREERFENKETRTREGNRRSERLFACQHNLERAATPGDARA